MEAITVAVGGEAGKGIAWLGEKLAKIAAAHGYSAFNYREYPSLIRGGLNFNVVRIAKFPVASHEWRADVVAYLDALAEKELWWIKRNDATIVLGKELSGSLSKGLPINAFYLGAISKILGFSKKIAEKVLEREKKFVKENKEAFARGYEAVNTVFDFSGVKSSERRFVFTGNQGVGIGAIAAGIDLYIAYPMTPATPVLHFLAALQDRYDLRAVQLENEIAVVNAALGASYAGAKVMVGTSGGGFALMAEAMSLQGLSEVPLVVYLAMRTGPSTGVPTYTAQGDVAFALHVGHGEFPRFVIAPGDAAEAVEATVYAFSVAYRFRVLSIILGDKHVGESHYTHTEKEIVRLPVFPSRELVKGPLEDFKSYEITPSGISPRSIPQWAFPVRATSYEHDEYGITVEGAFEVKAMVEKRLRKWETFNRAVLEELPGVKVYGPENAENAIIFWGSTKGAVLDALRYLPGWKAVQVFILKPLDEGAIRKAVEGCRKVIAVENSATCYISELLRPVLGFKPQCIKKYDARPFGFEEIVKEVKKLEA